MTNQDNQNKLKVKTMSLSKSNKRLAFVGCENCQLNCCGGTYPSRSSVLLYELHDVAKLFPVIFEKHDGNLRMSYIFSLAKGTPCPYQNSDSKKCTVYDKVRPRICKTFPFRIDTKTTPGSKPTYKISALPACPGIKESSRGLQIITAEGKIADEVIDNFIGREVLVNYDKYLSDTNKFLRLVVQLNLLAIEGLVIDEKVLPGGDSINIKLDVLKISEKKLADLDAGSMEQLKVAGYINAINIHLKSLSNFRKLYQTVSNLE